MPCGLVREYQLFGKVYPHLQEWSSNKYNVVFDDSTIIYSCLLISALIRGNSKCSCAHNFRKWRYMIQPLQHPIQPQPPRILHGSGVVHVVELFSSLVLWSTCAWIAENNKFEFLQLMTVCIVKNVQVRLRYSFRLLKFICLSWNFTLLI
jgi:hypothetical protein